jgi:hypothetical protein
VERAQAQLGASNQEAGAQVERRALPGTGPTELHLGDSRHGRLPPQRAFISPDERSRRGRLGSAYNLRGIDISEVFRTIDMDLRLNSLRYDGPALERIEHFRRVKA